jgi:HEAT repeat protein
LLNLSVLLEGKNSLRSVKNSPTKSEGVKLKFRLMDITIQFVAKLFGVEKMRLFKRNETNVEKMKAEKDLNGLIRALKDNDCEVQEAAADALGEMGDARAVEPLINALKDENSIVRKAAKDALRENGWKNTV